MVKNEKNLKKKKKTGKIIAPLVLVFVLAALIFGYVMMKNHNDAEKEKEEAGETVEHIDVAGKSTFTVTKMAFGDGISVSYINDEWVYDKDEHYPLNTDVLLQMAEAAKKFNAVSRVNDPLDDLSEYGLADPSLTFTAEYSDGSTMTCNIGIVNDFNGYRYMTVSGDDNIYMVETDLYDIFNRDENDIFKKDTWMLLEDSIFASQINSIVLETSGGKSKTITDKDIIEEVYDYIYRMNLNDWEDYYADDAEMFDSYGIGDSSDRISVNYTAEKQLLGDDGNTTVTKEDKTFTLRVGLSYETVPEDGEEAEKGYFYSPTGSTIVYTIDADTVETVFSYVD